MVIIPTKKIHVIGGKMRRGTRVILIAKFFDRAFIRPLLSIESEAKDVPADEAIIFEFDDIAHRCLDVRFSCRDIFDLNPRDMKCQMAAEAHTADDQIECLGAIACVRACESLEIVIRYYYDKLDIISSTMTFKGTSNKLQYHFIGEKVSSKKVAHFFGSY